MTQVEEKKLVKELIRYYELGISSLEDIQSLTGIDSTVLINLIDKYPQLYAAKRTGTLKTNLKVVEALLKAAMGYKIKEKVVNKKLGKDGKTIMYKEETDIIKEVGPNTNAIRFWLQAKDSTNWKELINDTENKFNISVKVNGKDITVEKDKE